MIAKKSIKGKYGGKCPKETCQCILIEHEEKCPKCGLKFDEPAKAVTVEGKPIEED